MGTAVMIDKNQRKKFTIESAGTYMLDVRGDIGFDTEIAGPVTLDIHLDPDDISDFTDSALGLGGYAATGKRLFQLSYEKLKLEGKESEAFIDTTINFDITSAEFTASYTVYQQFIFNVIKEARK